MHACMHASIHACIANRDCSHAGMHAGNHEIAASVDGEAYLKRALIANARQHCTCCLLVRHARTVNQIVLADVAVDDVKTGTAADEAPARLRRPPRPSSSTYSSTPAPFSDTPQTRTHIHTPHTHTRHSTAPHRTRRRRAPAVMLRPDHATALVHERRLERVPTISTVKGVVGLGVGEHGHLSRCARDQS